MATHWRYRAGALAALSALVWVAAALAGFDVTRWGTPGFGDGEFTNVLDVAVGPTGTVYTVDTTPGRIQRFTAAGKFIASSEASGGQFIAVDSTGIYVSRSSAGGRVQHLTPTGGNGPQWAVPNPRGIAVKDGFVYVVANSGSEVRKYSASGTLIKSWPISTTEIFPGGLDLAIDPAGNVYVVQNWGAIRKYSPGGELLTTGYTGVPGEIYGLGVNPWTGEVWVSADDANAMVELSSSLDKVLATVTTAGLSSPRGVGVGCTDAYVANNGKNEIVRIHPTSAPLCGVTKLPRVWFPPVEIDTSTKKAKVSGTCLGPGRCIGLLGIETLARKCKTGGRATRCVLARIPFNFGKGETIRFTVKLKGALDLGTAITLINLKGKTRLLPLDRVALARASSSMTLGCRAAGRTGESFPYSGTLAPAVGGAHVRLAIASPDGSVEVREATTDAAGKFNGSFSPRGPGSYSVLAFWRGNTKLDGAQSPACGFTVSQTPTTTSTTTSTSTTTGTTTTTPGGRPDLVISDLTKDSATVQNIGNAAAGSFMVTVTTTAGPAQFLIEDLPAGSSATVSFFCQAGPVTAVADSANQITESNETNNTKTIAVLGCISKR